MADSPGVARLLDRYPGARQMLLISFPFGRVMRFMRVGQETRLLLIQVNRQGRSESEHAVARQAIGRAGHNCLSRLIGRP